MGAVWGKFTKKKTAIEELEAIEKQTKYIEEYRRDSQQRQKRYVGALILYSIILYILFGVIFYFYYFPNLWIDRIIYSLPLLFFPCIVWVLKRLLHAYFRYRITTSEEQIGDLRRRKKKILDEVKEQEKYVVAKEILEKFDPTVKEEKEKAAKAFANEDLLRLSPGTELRQRFVGGRGIASSFKPSVFPMRGRGIVRNFSSDSSDMASQPSLGRPPGPPLPRPILPRERTAVDRVIEYLVGDGPSNRYALICKRCFSHNGMALKEEFDYLTFRCCYCHAVNPARKQRPHAPRLPESSPEMSATPIETEEESEEETYKVDTLPDDNASSSLLKSVDVEEKQENEDDEEETEADVEEENSSLNGETVLASENATTISISASLVQEDLFIK